MFILSPISSAFCHVVTATLRSLSADLIVWPTSAHSCPLLCLLCLASFCCPAGHSWQWLGIMGWGEALQGSPWVPCALAGPEMASGSPGPSQDSSSVRTDLFPFCLNPRPWPSLPVAFVWPQQKAWPAYWPGSLHPALHTGSPWTSSVTLATWWLSLSPRVSFYADTVKDSLKTGGIFHTGF